MEISSLFKKTKKKLTDAVGGLGAVARNFKDEMNKPRFKSNPIPDANKVFKPVHDFLANINTRPLSSRADSTAGKIVGGIVETPYTFVTAVPKFYGQTVNEINSGKIFTKEGVKRTAGRAIETGLDTASVGLFGKAKTAYNAAKPLVRQQAVKAIAPKIRLVAKQGAKVGAGYGAGYGAAESLKENKDTTGVIKDTLKALS